MGKLNYTTEEINKKLSEEMEAGKNPFKHLYNQGVVPGTLVPGTIKITSQPGFLYQDRIDSKYENFIRIKLPLKHPDNSFLLNTHISPFVEEVEVEEGTYEYTHDETGGRLTVNVSDPEGENHAYLYLNALCLKKGLNKGRYIGFDSNGYLFRTDSCIKSENLDWRIPVLDYTSDSSESDSYITKGRSKRYHFRDITHLRSFLLELWYLSERKGDIMMWKRRRMSKRCKQKYKFGTVKNYKWRYLRNHRTRRRDRYKRGMVFVDGVTTKATRYCRLLVRPNVRCKWKIIAVNIVERKNAGPIIYAYEQQKDIK